MPCSADPGTAAPTTPSQDGIDYWRQRLDCAFAPVQSMFADRLQAARACLGEADLAAYIEAARLLCKLGRGAPPVLAFLEAWPAVAVRLGPQHLEAVMTWVRQIQRTPNGDVLGMFFETLPAVADALGRDTPLSDYLDLLAEVAKRSTASIHGRHAILPSHALPELIRAAPERLQQVRLEGLRTWVKHGLRHYAGHPQRQADYLAMRLADSRAIFQGQRGGTLLRAHERQMDLYLRACWDDPVPIIAYSEAFDTLRKPQPHADALGLHLPDLCADRPGVRGPDQYRLMVAHLAAHRRFTQALIGDNWSPFQRLAIECLEDARIDTLLMRRFPGLRRPLLALHPRPREGACDPARESCIRHRLAMLSRAILDPEHDYHDPLLRKFVDDFHERLAHGDGDTQGMAALATEYIIHTRRPSDALASVHFADTEVPYRDDNRHLWRFIDAGEESDDAAPAPAMALAAAIIHHYPEWDYTARDYLPDHVTLHERLHARGPADEIERLLQKNAVLARRLTRILDQIKPQDRERLRRQEDGAELDLDWALRSWIDYRCRRTIDQRINQDFRHARRDVAVSLLLDLSASLQDPIHGGRADQTVLSLAQEAVTLLAWAIDRLGDPFAIAGFHSNTRHDARFWHIKGFSEAWGDEVRGRLAALQAGYSTRMGVALRHAGHYLAQPRKDKRLLLVLTDGQPADLDVSDPEYLIADTRQAVRELERQGIYCHCISLDARADDYVRRIFGQQFSIIDRIERLPERLPEIFLTLTA
ncbi:hypothetical protein [Acidiferrobacter sp.]|jgi:hypothetical protein|uniref:nitric oxide reductase activation protein NorD n=1 Tax=Acidiferrobacter sp. TaxID=1872107 RepID=UPI002635D5DF|nr:hypothetical protein [Acidiferrobacter sp.]